MNTKINQTIIKILNSTDSDDVLSIALYSESNLRKEDKTKLKSLLNKLLIENTLTVGEAISIKQFISFLD